MNRHEHFKQMLARRSELSPQEELDLQQHLRDCPECRETATAYARQAALLRSLPLADPPAALRARVLSGIQQQPPARAKGAMNQSLRSFLLLVPLAAVLILVVGVLALLNRPHHANNTAAPPSTPRVTIKASTTAPTPRVSTVRRPTPTPTTVPTVIRKGRGRPSTPSSIPPAPQVGPLPTPVPGVNTPILSQALPTPTVRVAPASPKPVGTGYRRPPPSQTAPPPTRVTAAQPTPTTGRGLPPGVALAATPPVIRPLPPPTPAPPSPPVQGTPAAPVAPSPTPTSAPPPPAPPPPASVNAPASPVATPTPIP